MHRISLESVGKSGLPYILPLALLSTWTLVHDQSIPILSPNLLAVFILSAANIRPLPPSVIIRLKIVQAATGSSDFDLSQLSVDARTLLDASREALSFASGQAAGYAGEEEKEIHRLVSAALELQSQMMEVKLRHIKDLSQVGQVGQ